METSLKIYLGFSWAVVVLSLLYSLLDVFTNEQAYIPQLDLQQAL